MDDIIPNIPGSTLTLGEFTFTMVIRNRQPGKEALSAADRGRIMYRKCTTEISVQHQRQVEETLLSLMEKTPFGDITVTQLCEASGVSRRVFYHLFSNKTGALWAMIDHKILAFEGAHPEIDNELLRFFCYWREQELFLDVLLENNLAGLLLERLVTIAMYEDYDLKYWLKTQGWSETKDILVFHLTGIMGLVYSWHHSGFDRTPQEMAALLERITGNGIRD